MPYDHIIYRKNPSCGCHNSKGNNHSGWKGYGEISGSYFTHIKWSAQNRQINFDISIEDMWNQYIKQNKKCALTGIPIKQPDFDYTQNNLDIASLDRIDSSKGYTKGNIQWVTVKINQIKMDLSQDEFINLCRMVTIFNDKNISN